MILAPAMNTAMWYHPLTKKQFEAIQEFANTDANSNNRGWASETGVIILEPATKTLACGEIGVGALAELDDIVFEVKKCLKQVGLKEIIETTNHDVRHLEK